MFHRQKIAQRSAATLLFSAATLISTGCVQQQAVTAVDTPGVQLGGNVRGGEQPVTGAVVSLYATGVSTGIANGAYTGTATLLGTTTSGAGGGWTFNPASYTCPANQIVYVASAGGNPGAGTNSNILELSMLGVCGSLNAFTDVDEVTTAAAAYTFSTFLTVDTSGANPVVNIVAPVNNASFAATNDVTAGTVLKASGLLHAYQNFTNLVDPVHGTAYAAPLSNASAIAPQAMLNTLGNILQSCVNTTNANGTTSANCAALFAGATSAAIPAPTTTLQAVLNLARNPYSSTTARANLFNLGTSQSAFMPTLASAPKDFTLAISYPVPPNPVSGVGFAFMAALDADDNVYVSSPENDPYAVSGSSSSTVNSTSACLFGWTSNGAFRPVITPYSGAAGTAGTQGTGTPGTSNWLCSGAQAATAQSDFLLTALAPDSVGNVWVVNYGKSSTTPAGNNIVKVSNAGTYTAQYPTAQQAGATQAYQAQGLAVDKSNDVFYSLLTANSAVANVAALTAGTGATASTGAALTLGSISTGPTCSAVCRTLALDSSQNLAASGYGASSVTSGVPSVGGFTVFLPVTTATAQTYGTVFKVNTNGGTGSNTTTNAAPWGVAFDTAGNVWTTTSSTSFHGLSELTPSTAIPYVAATNTVNVTSAFTSPKGDEVDGAGNVWVADTTGVFEYNPGTATIMSETGGFQPCITASGTTTCTYPDNAFTKTVSVDSTGSVWWTTPDSATTTANSNRLIQMLGAASATWPLLATGKPGAMPQ